MSSEPTIHAAADTLLRLLRPTLHTPSAAAGCAVTELVNAALRQPDGDEPGVVGLLGDIAFGLGLQISQLDPALREGVLRVLKNRLNDGARRADEALGTAVH